MSIACKLGCKTLLGHMLRCVLFALVGIALSVNLILIPQNLFAQEDSGVSVSDEGVLDYVAVLVNGQAISHKEILSQVQKLEEQKQVRIGENLYDIALDQLITQKVLLDEARRSGIQVSDNALDQAIANIAQNNQVSEAVLRRNLNEQGQSFAAFRENLRQDIALSRLQQQQRNTALVTVTEEEIAQQIAEMEWHQQLGGAEINLGHILILMPPEALAQERKARKAKARRAYQLLASGDAFEKVAAEYSEAPEAQIGGELGLRPVEEYPKFFLDAVREVPVGGVTTVLRSPVGLHILRVLDRRGGEEKAPLSQVKTQVRHILLTPNAQMGHIQTKEKLQDFKQQIEQNQADFATLAQQHSQDTATAAYGGMSGWITPGMLMPELEAVIDTLAVGELSDPVISRHGIHLIEVLAREEEVLSQDEVRTLAYRAAQAKKREEDLQKWIGELRDKAFVEKRGPPAPSS